MALDCYSFQFLYLFFFPILARLIKPFYKLFSQYLVNSYYVQGTEVKFRDEKKRHLHYF